MIAIFAILALGGRQTALSRLFEAEPAEELRWTYFPILLDMAGDFVLSGSGFGSFEKVFNQYEPAETLSTRYLNQAHMDPLQLIIEGGLPALILLILGLAWIASCIAKIWLRGRKEARNAALYIAASLVIWMAASFVDYPLRTPLAASIFAILTAYLSALSVRVSIPSHPT